MKRLLIFAIAILSASSAMAGERVIDPASLPQTIKDFIATNFADQTISISTEERDFISKDYKVILTDGTKAEFDGSGMWIEVERMGNAAIPAAIIPSHVASYVSKRFPANHIVKIEQDKRGVDVELNNDIDLKFNTKGELVEFDN